MQSLLLHLTLLIAVPLPVCFAQGNIRNSSYIGVSDANTRFGELATRYEELRRQFFTQEAEEGEDLLKGFLENYPMNAMVADFLALERQTRGSEIGFSCLYHLVLAANGGVFEGDFPVANYPATKGKIAALRILRQHYFDYPDIDTTFRYVFSGPAKDDARVFLRSLISSSPHKHVRANAMSELARHLALEANLPRIYQSRLAVLERSVPVDSNQIEDLKKLLSEIEDISIERKRAEARVLRDRIRDDYADEPITPRTEHKTPVLIQLERGESRERLNASCGRIADRLPAIEFEINHSIGKTPPSIDCKDANGNRMKLSDFHGKVVVLFFSFKGCGPCERLYPANRKLIDEMADEPFAFLGVQGDETIETIHKSLESGEITWRVWWDGEDNRHSARWNIEGWPSTFVLDKSGIMRFRGLRGKELATAVRILLKENAEQVDAREPQIKKSCPVPNS
ncbi:MAG: TlpA family protein disulfide reductase [Rhodopirellula sp. JB044]|uniref:TlpA family protein disulfide reductase n=1 Tax=Rhodopirellula sp. JB044 TaxID=3342844 RepID=UPI00370A07CA